MKTKPSRLIQLLSALSNDEIKRLNRFVQATYFNTDKYVTKLLDVLNKDIIGKRTFDELVQWRVYGKVFNKSPQSQEKLNEKEKKLLGAKMSALTQLTKDFLAVEALKEHKTYRNDLLLSELLNRKQFDLFQSVMKKERKALEAEQERGIKYHQHEYMIEQKTLNYLLLNRNLLTKNDNLMELNRSLDTRYLLDKLNLHIGTISISSSFLGEKSLDFSSFKAINNLLSLPHYQNHPLIKIYQVITRMMQTRQHEHYEVLLELLNTQSQYIPKENTLDFYNMLNNFCAFQIRSGLLEYHIHLFELYKVMEDRNLLIESDSIPVNKLKNAIAVACHVKEFEWSKYTIEKYHPYISKSIRDSVRYFNIGVIAFYQKNYKAAIGNFIRVERINVSYDVGCKLMILKSHYETDEEYDERTAQIFRSAEKFINDNKHLSPANKKGYKNFINTLINLYRVKHRAGKMTPQSIRQKIEKFDLINDKRWLLEKIDELENKKSH